MTLDPLLSASPVIRFHALAAVMALGVGLFQFFRLKGDGLHRVLGYLWVALICFAAISSFWISGLRIVGPFSPIHLLSAWALVNVSRGVLAARAGDVAAHRGFMRGLYLYALVVAGLLTFLPGRVMHEVVFGAQ